MSFRDVVTSDPDTLWGLPQVIAEILERLRRLEGGIAAYPAPTSVAGGDHATEHEVGGGDAVVGLLDANARVAVRKNSAGSDFGPRRRINLIEGSNVTITVSDDIVDEEVDVTITAASGSPTFGSPGSSIVGEGGADGVSANSARADHEHDRRTDFVWMWSQVGV